MKYLFINSVAGVGSTGRIAAEKCRELMAQGHPCVLAYGRDKGNCDDIPTIRIGSSLDYNLHGALTRVLDAHGFGSRAATRRFLEQVKEFDPDVVWLHNIHGYYLQVELLFAYLKESRKKVIWTLHDCWAFTGHCPHFDYIGCEKWRTGCHHCDQTREYPASFVLDGSRENYERKRRAFTGVSDLTLITPSQWLADLVKDSFLGEYPVQVVHNRINTDIFRPTAGDFREKYDLEGKKMILGVAGVWCERKGLQDMVRLSQSLDKTYRVALVGLTQEQIGEMPETVLALPRTRSPRELAEIYSAADLFVNPTYEDTYPTVNLEARACGTRVVSYDTGGCRETLGDGDTLVPRGDFQALLEAVCKE